MLRALRCGDVVLLVVALILCPCCCDCRTATATRTLLQPPGVMAISGKGTFTLRELTYPWIHPTPRITLVLTNNSWDVNALCQTMLRASAVVDGQSWRQSFLSDVLIVRNMSAPSLTRSSTQVVVITDDDAADKPVVAISLLLKGQRDYDISGSLINWTVRAPATCVASVSSPPSGDRVRGGVF